MNYAQCIYKTEQSAQCTMHNAQCIYKTEQSAQCATYTPPIRLWATGVYHGLASLLRHRPIMQYIFCKLKKSPRNYYPPFPTLYQAFKPSLVVTQSAKFAALSPIRHFHQWRLQRKRSTSFPCFYFPQFLQNSQPFLLSRRRAIDYGHGKARCRKCGTATCGCYGM